MAGVVEDWLALGLSFRAAQVLAQEGIATVEQLRAIGDRERGLGDENRRIMLALLRIPNCGRATTEEIQAFLRGDPPKPKKPARPPIHFYKDETLIAELKRRGYSVSRNDGV